VDVQILYFASFRESAGRKEERVSLPDGSTVRDLWERLSRAVPGFAAFPAMPPAAVNRAYAGAETALSHGDEVTFLPPVAGG
jgi:molybdopterin synthase sulfur carrier subunit